MVWKEVTIGSRGQREDLQPLLVGVARFSTTHSSLVGIQCPFMCMSGSASTAWFTRVWEYYVSYLRFVVVGVRWVLRKAEAERKYTT
jgi:hypothetical protein